MAKKFKWKSSKKFNQRLPLATGRSHSAGGIRGARPNFDDSIFSENPRRGSFRAQKLIQADIKNGNLETLLSLWKNRESQIEHWRDAAKVLAKIQFLEGITAEVVFAEDLQEHPDIIAFREKREGRAPVHTSDTPEMGLGSRISPSNFLSLSELDFLINSNDISRLKEIWLDRASRIEFIEDAVRVLSTIRLLEGVSDHFEDYAELFDRGLLPDLPFRSTQKDTEKQPFASDKSDLAGDKRRVDQTVAARDGQAKFRQGLLEHYGATCMVTGESVQEVIEAAHIRPYDGPKTNDLSNGLLLRVDIHRLFDSGLLAVEPLTHRIHLHPSITSSSYQVYDGEKLRFSGKVILDEDALGERFKAATLFDSVPPDDA